AGPLAVPHRVDMSCRSCAFTAAIKASTAPRALEAPVALATVEGEVVLPPLVVVVRAHPAATARASTSTIIRPCCTMIRFLAYESLGLPCPTTWQRLRKG